MIKILTKIIMVFPRIEPLVFPLSKSRWISPTFMEMQRSCRRCGVNNRHLDKHSGILNILLVYFSKPHGSWSFTALPAWGNILTKYIPSMHWKLLWKIASGKWIDVNVCTQMELDMCNHSKNILSTIRCYIFYYFWHKLWLWNTFSLPTCQILFLIQDHSLSIISVECVHRMDNQWCLRIYSICIVSIHHDIVLTTKFICIERCIIFEPRSCINIGSTPSI